MPKRNKLSPEDHEFIHSLNAAIAETTPKKTRYAIYFWAFFILFFIVWASLTKIDEITRGFGKVVPSGENRIVQHLEGGIVKKIYVRVGQEVKKGDPLLKIDNEKYKAQYESTKIRLKELKAKIMRLQAESEGTDFSPSEEDRKALGTFLENEISLYESRQHELAAKIRSLKDQKRQKIEELKENKDRIVHLQRSAELINEEVKMMEPMVKQGVKSKVDFMKLQREQSQILSDLQSAKNAIPKIEASIDEITHNIEETRSAFKNEAKEELNRAVAEMLRVKEDKKALEDQMSRTIVRSPINGIIQQLGVHTIGGVVQPGQELIEIVPTDDTLWLEVKIKPSDIAFIYPGQKAIVKVTAYDFSIYGGLEGKVVHISADTTKDEKGNEFYTVHIRTDKNHLGSDEKPLKIIPGMTVSVDIMTGKKSIMDYILKPILKAKRYMFTER
jgi:adhesin transport system membrane fusion protein